MTDLMWSPEDQAWRIVVTGVHVGGCNERCGDGTHWLERESETDA